METGKRYYWIKLKESFMTSDTTDKLCAALAAFAAKTGEAV